MRDWFYIACAVLGGGTWVITSKLAVRNMSPMLVQLVTLYVYSSVAPLVFLWMKWRGDTFAWTRPGIFWATVTSVLGLIAVYAFMFALEHKPVNVVASLTSVYPGIAFVLAWLLLGEPMTVVRALGGIMIVAGCVLMNV